MADFFIILFDKKILPLSLPTCSDYKWCGIFFVTYYSTTYNKKSILCICSVWIGKKILVACSISSRWTRLRHAMVYTFYFNSVSTIYFYSCRYLFERCISLSMSQTCSRRKYFPTSFQFLRNSVFSRYWYNFNDCWSPSIYKKMLEIQGIKNAGKQPGDF